MSEDIADGTFVDFTATIGAVPANDCVQRNITGVNALGDHLLLTPGTGGTQTGLVYTIEFHSVTEDAVLSVCNVTDSQIDDFATNFNLLVIDA